jgi:hypothetical protein
MPVAYLNAMLLPAEHGHKRDDCVPKEFQTKDYQSGYDASTLVYDAIYFPGLKRICLICPKLLNLEPLIRSGRFSSGVGTHPISRLWRHKRYDEIWLKCAGTPDRLRFAHGDMVLECAPSVQDSTLFAGLNCAVLKSKDNDLTWIRDWANYHVRVHGLEGLIFFDNHSSKYSVEEVDQVLRSVPGLRQSLVIPAPFPFGPQALAPYRNSSLFLQVALLNIARLRFFRKAKAVLAIDLDELVSPTPEGSIFETTRRSLLGYTLFRGRWRDPQTVDGTSVRHADHVYRVKNDDCSVTKYCICPGGLFGLSHWDIHGAVRGFLKDAMTTDRVMYWHCRRITTNWKSARKGADPEGLVVDDELAALFGRVYQV